MLLQTALQMEAKTRCVAAMAGDCLTRKGCWLPGILVVALCGMLGLAAMVGSLLWWAHCCGGHIAMVGTLLWWKLCHSGHAGVVGMLLAHLRRGLMFPRGICHFPIRFCNPR